MQNENEEIRIISGEIKNGLFLKYSFKKKLVDAKDRIFNDTMNGKSDKPIHEDLKKAFKQLIPHYILICKQEDHDSKEEFFQHIIEDMENIYQWPGSDFKKISEDRINKENDDPNSMIANYRVPMFLIEGYEEEEGVVLNGTRTLSKRDGVDSISFPSPFIKWSDSKYPYIHELRIAVEECQKEVLAYYNGKCAPPRQLEMQFEDEEGNMEVTASGEITSKEVKVKKSAKPSKKQSKKNQDSPVEEIVEEVS